MSGSSMNITGFVNSIRGICQQFPGSPEPPPPFCNLWVPNLCICIHDMQSCTMNKYGKYGVLVIIVITIVEHVTGKHHKFIAEYYYECIARVTIPNKGMNE